jgi:hypothetical protein
MSLRKPHFQSMVWSRVTWRFRIGLALSACGRITAGAFAITLIAGPPALGQQPLPTAQEPVPLWDRPAASPLARDIERQLRRDLEHQLNLEQSRLGARSATPLQRYQTGRDVQLSRQRLDTLKTTAPNAPPIPALERRLDRASRPTGAISRSRGLESGPSSSLGLSGGIGGR